MRAAAAIIAAAVVWPVPAVAAPQEGVTAYEAHTRVTLVADRAAVGPGGSFRAGVYFEPDPGWHIYWLNPGDSGQPPVIEWRVDPEPALLGPLRWPYPTPHATPPLTTYVHDRPTLIERTITLPDDKAGEGADISVRVSWLACKEACEPGRADLRLPLRGGVAADVQPGRPELFALNDKRLPDTANPLTVRARTQGRRIVLTFTMPDTAGSPEGLRYYPAARDLIDHAAEQRFEVVDGGYRLSVPLAVARKTERPLGDVGGLLTVPSGDGRSGGPHVYAVVGERHASSGRFAGLAAICALALAGGLLLNLMPCVLPVLSLKVVRLAGGAGGRIDAAALMAYVAGVIGTFCVVGGSVLVLKAFGSEIGWGFQMQSPVFILLLIQIFVLVGAGLVREVHLPLVGAGVLRNSSEVVRSAWEGVLSVLAATPCIAPFMGSAVGYALSAGTAEAMLIFILLAAGYCVPVVLLAVMPALRSAIPRPGPWMESLKRWMLVPVAATLIWLVWVLSRQIAAGVLWSALGLTVSGLGLALFAARRHRGAALIVALVCLGGAYAAVSSGALPPVRSEARSAWVAYDPHLLRRSIEEGRAVFIDFTAAWCLTCQVNKRLVLDTPAADSLFAANGVVRMRADWTSKDDAISRQLRSYGRSGVPVYVFYRAGSDRPSILPELLTPDILREALELDGRS